MRIAHVRREEMVLGVSHEGAGPSYFKSCFDSDLERPWNFIHAVFFPPGSGIGHHTHTHAEEIFVSVDNAMQFTHNGRTAEVVGGAAVPLRSGESHGIYNHTDRDTLFFNFQCFDNTREPSSEDFGDNRVGVPLESIDRLPVGSGAIGPIVTRLKEAYFKVTKGEVDDYPEWRMPVYEG